MRTPLAVGSLFAGIGGLDLGLERAGMRTVWQVEIDEYARRVLAKHWPDVRRHDDVRTFPPGDPDDWRCDVVCGGFPCQDISNAGKKAGIDGERSGLWSEFARTVRVLRPRYVLIENVSALLVRGLDRVLWDLAQIGYDAEWECLPASAFGAPHIRERVFVVAYPDGEPGDGVHERFGSEYLASDARFGGGDVARRPAPGNRRWGSAVHRTPGEADWWATEPDVGRVADGIPARVDRLKCLGNAVVPQCAEFIGRLIVEHHRRIAEVEAS